MSDPMREFLRLQRAIDSIAVHTERYEAFAGDLRRARAEQERLPSRGARSRLGDVEAELVYLAVRASGPQTVVQVGCRDGRVSAWLLRALRDNGSGRLVGFDPAGAVAIGLPPDLIDGRWEPVAGDVRERVDRLPSRIDHLFLDAGRSVRLTWWCLPNLVARLRPGTPVCAGGVLRPALVRPLVLEWLRRTGREYFTASAAAEPVVARQLDRVRTSLGLARTGPPVRADAAVFFAA